MPSDENAKANQRIVDIGVDYPRFQLTKALRHAWASGDDRASAEAEKWQQVIEGMFSGALRIGARTPLKDTPAWVTLEVVTGGFVTGNLLAGGELTQQERTLAQELGFPIDPQTRAALNGYFLSDQGQVRLLQQLATGQFHIEVPEEAALLTAAWLLQRGDTVGATALLDHILPFFDRLRFFPRPPAEGPTGSSAQVCLQTAGETVEALRDVAPQAQIAAQTEAIQVWTPLYDRAVALLLETVDGELPSVVLDHFGKPIRDTQGCYRARGGLPCQVRPSDWPERARGLIRDYREKSAEWRRCRSWHNKRKPFMRILRAIETFADAGTVSQVEQGYLRIALARVIAKRGLPGSEQHKARRQAQRQQCAGPRYHDIAALLAVRLATQPAQRGLEDAGAFRQPISGDEATASVPEGTPLPGHLRRKVGRAQLGTVRELIDAGYITSADSLADVLPQMTSEVRASGIADRDLRRLYGQTYRAFRRRRSLLLVNLETQVKLEEIPWVAALDGYRQATLSDRVLAESLLIDVAALALGHFPHAILPNKLLQELRALAGQAGLDLPLVDEIAADIFMGRFSGKFARAARIAGDLMSGTLYERYYGISFALLQRVPADFAATTVANPQQPSIWQRLFGSGASSEPPPCDFSDYCVRLSGSNLSDTWNVAANGTIIEQAQIVTTHNLAALFRIPGLREALEPALPQLVRACFTWICRRQQIPLSEHHARLVMLKNTAYAWRQMIFFLSLLPAEEQSNLVIWMAAQLSQQPLDIQDRFQPVLTGLQNASKAKAITRGGGQRFLGWSVGRHWLMPG